MEYIGGIPSYVLDYHFHINNDSLNTEYYFEGKSGRELYTIARLTSLGVYDVRDEDLRLQAQVMNRALFLNLNTVMLSFIQILNRRHPDFHAKKFVKAIVPYFRATGASFEYLHFQWDAVKRVRTNYDLYIEARDRHKLSPEEAARQTWTWSIANQVLGYNSVVVDREDRRDEIVEGRMF